jgi:hypothetical protein
MKLTVASAMWKRSVCVLMNGCTMVEATVKEPTSPKASTAPRRREPAKSLRIAAEAEFDSFFTDLSRAATRDMMVVALILKQRR